MIEEFNVSVSPHIKSKDSTSKIMWTVNLVLLPSAIWGVIMFGIPAILVLFVSILFAILTEGLVNLIIKKNTLLDGSAFLTGILIGFNLPPEIPLYVPAIASIIAIAIFKWSFGGLGNNIVNPAIAGRVFVFFSWSNLMSIYSVPLLLKDKIIDSTTMATPLTLVKINSNNFLSQKVSSFDFLNSAGYKFSDFDIKATDFFANLFRTDFYYGFFDLFFGIKPGCVGEISIFLLLIGALILFGRKIITFHIPASIILTFSILVYFFGGLRYGTGFFSGDFIFEILSGGLILGAFFMATDMVTSPNTKKGAIIFGVGIGFLTFLIRFYGSFPEGMSLAILFMNLFVPIINKFCFPKKFGLANKNLKGRS